jgi:hypothetical protein
MVLKVSEAPPGAFRKLAAPQEFLQTATACTGSLVVRTCLRPSPCAWRKQTVASAARLPAGDSKPATRKRDQARTLHARILCSRPDRDRIAGRVRAQGFCAGCIPTQMLKQTLSAAVTRSAGPAAAAAAGASGGRSDRLLRAAPKTSIAAAAANAGSTRFIVICLLRWQRRPPLATPEEVTTPTRISADRVARPEGVHRRCRFSHGNRLSTRCQLEGHAISAQIR